MTELSALFHGFSVILTPMNLLLMLVGITLGVLIGVLPGLGGANGVADPAAPDLHDVAHLGDHHAVLHLLGRAVRRRDHLGAVQHPRRALVGGHHLRRLPDGAEGPGGPGPHGGLHLVLRRRLRRGGDDHLPGAAGGQVRAEVRPARILRGLPAHLLQLRGHGQGLAVQDPGFHGDRFRARRGRAWTP
jgi:hypothetical protein